MTIKSFLYTSVNQKGHTNWDSSTPPFAFLDPGDTLEIMLKDSSGGRLSRISTAADLAAIPDSEYNPLTGPFFIRNCKEGDTVRITVLQLEPSNWGWTGIVPNTGILASDFTEPFLQGWKIDTKSGLIRSAFAAGEMRPCIGTVGAVPNASGSMSVLPPHRGAGNIDYPGLVEGASIDLPATVRGGLISFGDGHAAQGEGEICGTGVECDMRILCKVDILETHSARSANIVGSTPTATVTESIFSVGNENDMMEAAKSAARALIDELVSRFKISPEQAYVTCSAFGRVYYSQMVNNGVYSSIASIPKTIFSV